MSDPQRAILYPPLKILVIEDNGALAIPGSHALKAFGHEVTVARTTIDALPLAESRRWDLLVIDRSAVQFDQFGPVRTLRSHGISTPFLLLSQLGEDAEPGAAVCDHGRLAAEFSAEELNSRVLKLAFAPRTLLQLWDLEVDTVTRIVKRNGFILELQPRGIRLLEFLVRNAGTILNRTTLLEKVWDYHFDPGTNVVESHISRLRAKVDRGFALPLIQTIRGMGYRARDPT